MTSGTSCQNGGGNGIDGGGGSGIAGTRNAPRATGRPIFYSINPNSSGDHLASVKCDWSGIADMARRLEDRRGAPTSGLLERPRRALWSVCLAAPLIAGNDVRSMTDSTRNILTNADVIDVDQDSLVARATPPVQHPRVLIKPLADGTVAVALFNAVAHRYRRPGQISRTVAPHDVAMLRISPAASRDRRLHRHR